MTRGEPAQPAVNAPPLSNYIAGDVMGTPVRATYWGQPGDAWSKVVNVYRVESGQLVIDRSVTSKP